MSRSRCYLHSKLVRARVSVTDRNGPLAVLCARRSAWGLETRQRFKSGPLSHPIEMMLCRFARAAISMRKVAKANSAQPP